MLLETILALAYMFLKSCSVIKLQSSPVKYNQFISFFHFKDISSIFFPKILSARISIPNNLESKAFNSLEASELFTAFLLRVQWNCMVQQNSKLLKVSSVYCTMPPEMSDRAVYVVQGEISIRSALQCRLVNIRKAVSQNLS